MSTGIAPRFVKVGGVNISAMGYSSTYNF